MKDSMMPNKYGVKRHPRGMCSIPDFAFACAHMNRIVTVSAANEGTPQKFQHAVLYQTS